MRPVAAAVLVLIACGSPQRAPSPEVCPRIYNGRCYDVNASADPIDAGAPVGTLTVEVDAAIDAAPDLSFLAEPPPQPSGPLVTFEDIEGVAMIVALQVVGEGWDGVDVDAPEPEMTIENGVEVFYVNNRFWCGKAGRWKNWCLESAADCRRAFGACYQVPNVACFSTQARIDGRQLGVCMSSYGECARMRTLTEINQDHDVSDACSVFRYRKPMR